MNITELFDTDEHHKHQTLTELDSARSCITSSLEPDYAAATRHIQLAAEYCRLLVPAAEKKRRNRSKPTNQETT